MTVTVEKNKFLNAIKAVKSSVSKVALQPALSTIHIKSENGGLTLTATDLDTTARAVCEANSTEPIEVCINANALESIVSSLNDLITLDVKEAKVIIKGGNTKYEVLYIQSSDFPQVDFDLTGNMITINKDEFINSANKAVISTSTDGGVLSGVCFTNNEFASTDGNRLSVVPFGTPLNVEGQYIIPRRILLDVIRNVGGDVIIYLSEKAIIFQSGNCLFKQNLLSGKFPNYAQLLPTEFKHKAVVDKAELLHSLERVSVMCDERTPITVFNFKDGELHLTTACDNGKAEDTIEVGFDGELKIAFNYRYMLEGLKVMQAEVIEFNMNSEISACIINGGYTYLLMPIQLRGDK